MEAPLMGNRIYLYCTNVDCMPRESEWDHFFANSGTEYEAQGHLPLLWLALFDEASIRINPANRNGFSDDERAYAYLLDSKDGCIARMRTVYNMVSAQHGNIIVRHVAEWIERLASEPYMNIFVRTEELDWMGKEGDLAIELRKALQHWRESLSRSEVRLSNAIRDLCGLSEIDELLNCEPRWVLGGANGPNSWPEAQTIESPVKLSSNRSGRPWWKFWP